MEKPRLTRDYPRKQLTRERLKSLAVFRKRAVDDWERIKIQVVISAFGPLIFEFKLSIFGDCEERDDEREACGLQVRKVGGKPVGASRPWADAETSVSKGYVSVHRLSLSHSRDWCCSTGEQSNSSLPELDHT